MNKNELISSVASRTGLTKKDTALALTAITDVIIDELKEGNKVQIVGFGTFSVKKYKDKTGRNFRTGETVLIPGCTTPSFKPGDSFKNKLNEK